MKVLVCGSRRWHRRDLVAKQLIDLTLEHAPDYPIVIHGAARGADRIAEDEAGKAGLVTQAFPADWGKHGKRAGIIRNIQMLDEQPDLVLAFWDGRSTGTKHTINEARRRGIPVRVIRP